MPKKVKYRKSHKGRKSAVASKGNQLSFGSFGLQSMGSKWITSRQIEAGRRAIVRYLRKGGKLWIRIFPNKPVTFKGNETPMGGGKGSVDHYVFPVDPGRMIFELDGIDEKKAREALGKAADKIAVKTKIVKR